MYYREVLCMPQTISNNITRICRLCGQEFKPHARKQYCCGEIRKKACIQCGNEFEYVCNPDGARKLTCSTKCQAQYTKTKRMKSASYTVKICKWCGKEFVPESVRDVYCRSTHYQTCAVCGKKFEIDVRVDPYVKTCSSECRYKLMAANQDRDAIQHHLKKTMQEKYGVDNAMQLPGVIDKMKQTNLDKYGTEWYTQTDAYKEQVKQTSLEKYGVEHHLQSPEVIAKRTQTVQERYGVPNVFQSDKIKQQIMETIIDRYGVFHISRSPAIQQKIEESNYRKYGVKHPMMLKEFQDKVIQTNIDKFGNKAYTQKHIPDIAAWYEFTYDPEDYIKKHYSDRPRSAEIAADLGVDVSTIDVYLKRHDAQHCVKRAHSLMEIELLKYIQSLDSSIKIIQGSRNVIPHGEIDLYMPEYKFGIECNPTCTHNSSVKDPWGGEPKSHAYHQQKTDKCDKEGVFLFHIFGSEWEHKQDIIKSMIRNVLGKNTDVIYARKCVVKEVSGSDSMKFLNQNHRQGYAQSPIRLGLYYNDKLVSLMTFGKMRNTIGTGKDDLTNTYELVRFCNVLNTSVVGGASKLFKYFVKDYHPEAIRSFSDRAHTRGNLYSTLGFSEIRRSEPNYVWVDLLDDRAYHRVNAQKKNICKFLNDDSIDLTKSETYIMETHGFVRVYDSGTITWEWRRQE